jgi:hypothetical protein
MLGVVLWSDPQENKAVIWCEDQGDLAFYRQSDGPVDAQVILDAGDLVKFDMTMERHLRFAHNPQLVSEGMYPELAQTLNKVQPDANPRQVRSQPDDRTMERSSAQIIPFAPRSVDAKRHADRPVLVTG